jgi:hypothetical protein
MMMRVLDDQLRVTAADAIHQRDVQGILDDRFNRYIQPALTQRCRDELQHRM